MPFAREFISLAYALIFHLNAKSQANICIKDIACEFLVAILPTNCSLYSELISHLVDPYKINVAWIICRSTLFYFPDNLIGCASTVFIPTQCDI